MSPLNSPIAAAIKTTVPTLNEHSDTWSFRNMHIRSSVVIRCMTLWHDRADI
jgi:hypothetical protein